MTKHRFCLLTLVCLLKTGSAQDQLFKKDNSKVLVKITEINPSEIKYKLFNNLSGPTYVEDKNNVSLIIYENGQHEVISVAPPANAAIDNGYGGFDPGTSRADSLTYYKYTNSISINFLNFFNNEIGLTYQKDFFKSHFNIVVPLAIGLEKPSITQSVYINNITNYYNYNTSSYGLTKKLFDVGFGINYYPSLRTNVNYYIGPVFKYMQYSGTQTYNYLDPNAQNPYNRSIVTKNSVMSRYTMSITNGVIFRTRSRITMSVYASLGFKNDVVNDLITDPITNTKVSGIRQPISLFFWGGFNVGYNF
jgi:hypothetical protein